MNTEQLDTAIDRLNKSANGYGDVIRVLTALVAQYGFYEGRKVLAKVLPEWSPSWESR